ncbi:GGDEF domain-containing protein [Asanoa sp. NPDC049518]|uniref:GGDEF domain-containing protein n=1 Tax=unclassified Asanoa TaxID=2685164 RepID=UPI00342AFACC
MDRILGAALALFAVAAVLIGWGPAPGVTSWAAQAVLDAAFTTLSWQLAQRRGQGARRRRFWEAAAVAGLILAAGAVLRAVEAVTDPASATAIRTVPGILLTIGTGVLLATMLARPWRVSRRERSRLWLDMVTVMVGAAVAIWAVTVSSRSYDGDQGEKVWAVVGAATLLVAALALIRLVSSESTPVRRRAGVTLGLAVALFGVDRVLNADIAAAPDLRAILVARMVPALLLLASARFEQLRRPPAAVPPRARRSGARLPIVAVSVTQIVLVVELATRGLTSQTWGALAGSVVVTALVLARQHVVLVDNERLVRRLDETVATLAREEDALRYAAGHDHLTGLANRSSFDERARELDARVGEDRAVLLLDLDDFKTVNDTLGHRAGDDLLRVTAGRLAACLGPTDTAARMGGDEFSVLLTDATVEDAVAAAHRVLGTLREPVRIEGRTVRPSASVGIAASSTKSYEALLRDADEAMYEAKRRNSGFHLHPDDTR